MSADINAIYDRYAPLFSKIPHEDRLDCCIILRQALFATTRTMPDPKPRALGLIMPISMNEEDDRTSFAQLLTALMHSFGRSEFTFKIDEPVDGGCRLVCEEQFSQAGSAK